MNLRDEIKTLFQTTLVDNTDAGSSVSISRVRRAAVSDFPVVYVYTTQETNKREGRVPDQYLSTCTVQVDVLTQLTDVSEKELDTITGQIEDLILNLDPQESIANGSDLYLVGTDIFLYGSDDKQTLAGASVTFNYEYNVNVPEPTAEDTLSVELINETEDINAAQ